MSPTRLLLLVLCLLIGSFAHEVAAQTQGAAADGRVFTQNPEIAPAISAAAPTPPPPTGTARLWQEGPVPTWIWGADQDQKYVLRKTFKGGTKAARVKASSDNLLTLFVNGQKVASSSEWQAPVEVDVQKHLKDGENVITAEVENEGGAAAFVLKLALTRPDDKVEYVVSDDSWKAADSAKSENWAAVKILGKLGIPPWNNVFAATTTAAGIPRDTFELLPGFQVERLFTVPKDKLGSWVNITVDDKGRLIASDQGNLGLCRITPPPIGSDEPTKVEHLDVKMSGVQGFLFAFGSLYVSVNGGPGSGLYRLRDTDNNDQFDEVTKLKDFRGGGEHGPHALQLSPDGKSIVVICGNHTLPPFDVTRNAATQTLGGARPEQLQATLPAGATSRIAPNWDEDMLPHRLWDANGHAVGILAPGGWIAQTDPEGKNWEMLSIGYRNPFDMAFNADGELFAYDADMEWDYGMPWHRQTRVVHATSGSEFGWRSGAGKWPAYFVDSLPELIDIGPGSPVGVAFGYGTKFPAKYQRALYICDWTFGTMYAIHIEPNGASYKAVKEEFVARTPLPLTDTVVGKDGALYFTIGGRGAQSELFRVTYVGKESTEPAELKDAQGAELRDLRHSIEAYHTPVADTAKAVEFLVPHLSHPDRFIRYAARVALERQPLEAWSGRILESTDAETLITGAVGLARVGQETYQPRLLTALKKLEFAGLSEAQQLELLRAYQLILIRLGTVDDALRQELAASLDKFYPAKSDLLNRELCTVLVGLQSPTVARKTVPMMLTERVIKPQDLGNLLTRNGGYGGAVASVMANQPHAQQIHYAYVLRNLKEGWSLEDRKEYFLWFQKAQKWSGGASYQKYLINIENQAFDNCTDAERLAVEAIGARKPFKLPELPKPEGPGREWTLADIVGLSDKLMKGRDFKAGQKAYSASRCVVCHRFGGEGGATGPDLTQLAGRFNLKDLTEAIVDPSKVVSDQYKATIVETKSGKVYTGRIVNESKDSISIVTDPENSTKVAEILRSDIEEMQPAKASLMPKDLLNQFNEQEVLNLLAYLLSRGNPNDPMFK